MTNNLTPTEQLYFDALRASEYGVKSKALQALHPTDVSQSNAVDMHICNLRRKLKGRYRIRNKWGWGFKLEKI